MQFSQAVLQAPLHSVYLYTNTANKVRTVMITSTTIVKQFIAAERFLSTFFLLSSYVRKACNKNAYNCKLMHLEFSRQQIKILQVAMWLGLKM